MLQEEEEKGKARMICGLLSSSMGVIVIMVLQPSQTVTLVCSFYTILIDYLFSGTRWIFSLQSFMVVLHILTFSCLKYDLIHQHNRAI